MIYSDPFSISDEVEARTDVTIVSVVRAAWAFVVHQYTGTDGVVFGAPLAGRNMAVSNIDRWPYHSYGSNSRECSFR